MQVSVVIPTYNRAAFIREALTSVLQQTFQDFEILVIDDGSTDNTADLVKQIGDARIRYLTQNHLGVSAALDLGWRSTHGAYIARLDSDDRWLPDLLQELVTMLDSDPSLGVAFARAQGMDAQGQLLTQLIGTEERFPGHTLKSLIYGDFVCPIAVLIRRSALNTQAVMMPRSSPTKIGIYGFALPPSISASAMCPAFWHTIAITRKI